MKIGFGFDAHILEAARPLKLGGVEISFPRGLRGHSDGDVVLHALSDAILGASAKGDIGVFFRDDDRSIDGIDSRKILSFSIDAARESALRITNIDLVIVADNPRLSPHYTELRESIAGLCKVPLTVVSVKSKTAEGTLVGADSIACFASVLMEEL